MGTPSDGLVAVDDATATPENAQQKNSYVCSCEGCWCCSGREDDCTCDVDWDALTERWRRRD